MRRLLVTGCGRSGTGSTAALLAASGLACGHEALFNPERIAAGLAAAWPAGVQAESSWLAAPFLRGLPEGTLVVHQVRHPLAVVRSFHRIRLFEGRSVWRRFAERHCDEVASGTPLERCVAYWIGWNRLVEREAAAAGVELVRVAVELLDTDFLEQLLGDLGIAADRERILAALARHPADTNTSGDKVRDGELGVEALLALPCGAELARLAAEYGYAPPSPAPV